MLTKAAGAEAIRGVGLEPGVADPRRVDALSVPALMTEWERLSPPVRMLVVVDMSGSMDWEAGDSTRIDIVRTAAASGLGLLSDTTQVGIWFFSTERGSQGQDWEPVVPVRALDADVDGQSQRQVVAEATESFVAENTTGDTGLHDTILAAFLEVQDGYQPGYGNTVVLMTDGVNDDPAGGLSEEELIAELEGAIDPDRPVRLILIGMGPDVDQESLERIAEVTNGRALVTLDPADIGSIFARAMQDRGAVIPASEQE